MHNLIPTLFIYRQDISPFLDTPIKMTKEKPLSENERVANLLADHYQKGYSEATDKFKQALKRLQDLVFNGHWDEDTILWNQIKEIFGEELL